MEKKAVYRVDRKFCEKLIVLMNHSTNPLMDIFKAGHDRKKRVTIEYDPQAEKVEITYYE